MIVEARKICSKCGIAKDLLEFGKAKLNKDGYKGVCRECLRIQSRIYKKEYYKIPENRERRRLMNKLNKDLRKDTPEYKARVKQENKRHYEKNKDVLNANKKIYASITRDKRNAYLRKWTKDKYENDIQFKISKLLRERIRSVVKGKAKMGSAVSDLGCSLEFFRVYIESKFKPGMTWKNHGKFVWHIDHIKPLSLFNLEDSEEFLKAVHYTNLQPLWAIDNLKKGNSFNLKSGGVLS